MSKSTGAEFAEMTRKYFRMNGRTRTYRNGLNVKEQVLEAIMTNNQYPGYYSESQTPLFQSAFPVLNAYDKHVRGGRISGALAYRIERMTPWQFVGLLGEMIDAGVSNSYEGELFFRAMVSE